MIINEEGTYTLKYTATDECGKSSTVDRELVVTDNSPRRTVLYTDGTFIINEKQTDEAHNIELHGAATNVYPPLDPNGVDDIDRYIFGATGYRPWHSERTSIKAVEIGSKISPESTSYWFSGFSTCESINLANLNTDGANSMASMFSGCRELTSLDLSGIDTSSVESMSDMFNECVKLTSLDLSGFNTSNVTNMSRMFYYCSVITSIDVSSFDTSHVLYMNAMFGRCSALQDLDTSGFDASVVTNMIDMFLYCNKLESLDLSGFDTSDVTDMTRLFSCCSLLKTIYTTNLFDVANVNASTDMFESTSVLVGGAGTIWSDSNPKDKTYAHIDGGTSSPGYFTLKSA